MSAAQIQARVKRMLARAVERTGSSSSEKVFLVTKTTTGTSPLNTGVETETETELVNAIFAEYSIDLIGGNIKAGDRILLSDSDVLVSVGDSIKQGTSLYIVMAGVDRVELTSDNLMYQSQVRLN
ncbi:MAG: hypothetical protein MJK15_03225 [Colwellia sp.]|nr:hypothetical protein [Colwellia sp.]